MMNSSLVVLSIGQFMTYVMFTECDQTSLRGTKDPFKFAPLLTCGLTAMLVVHSCQPVSAWHGCEFPSKPENFFPLMIESCSLHVKMMLWFVSFPSAKRQCGLMLVRRHWFFVRSCRKLTFISVPYFSWLFRLMLQRAHKTAPTKLQDRLTQNEGTVCNSNDWNITILLKHRNKLKRTMRKWRCHFPPSLSFNC